MSGVDLVEVVRVGNLDWHDRANCRGIDLDLFFTERGEATWPAKQVCAGCEVRAECLDHALSVPERFGVWGGLSEDERRRIRRTRIRARRDAEISSLPRLGSSGVA